MRIKSFPAVVATVAVAASLGAGLTGCSLFSNGPDTVASKFRCTETVNGRNTQAYCIQDSNGNNFYLNYIIWRQLFLGQQVDHIKGVSPSYFSDTSHEPADKDVPVSDHNGTDDPHFSGGDDGGGDHGGFSGGHGGGGK
jgi:hypothetical protein